MSERHDIETADTEPPQQEPFADAPCDTIGCVEPWYERVEWHDRQGHLHVRFVCKRHATDLLRA